MTPQDRQRVLFNAGIGEELAGRADRPMLVSGGTKYTIVVAGRETACLDGDFTADELEAVASWMREHAKT